MAAEGENGPDQEGWNHLIGAVAATQDRGAFAVLFKYFAPRIKTFMLRSGESEAGAEELAQETMLAVWRKARLYNPEAASAAAWIFTIARNLRIDAYRRRQRGTALESQGADAEYQMDDAPLPDKQLDAMQSEARVRSALKQLSAEQIRVVELSFFEERAHGDIAKVLGIPLGTVKSRLRLAMVRLRQLLDGLS